MIVARASRQRMKIPKGILNAPQLLPGLELFWWAYQDLSSCRPASFGGALPIPWTAIKEYAVLSDLDPDQTDDMVYFIRKMDSEFLVWYEEHHGSKSKSKRVQPANDGRGRVSGLGR